MNQSSDVTHLAAGKSADAADLIIRRRHRLATSLMPPRGGVLLDFGCGNGAQTLLFTDAFDAVVGVDITDAFLDEFAGRLSSEGSERCVVPVRYDGHNVPLADDSVDYAISFEVLEHVEDEAGAIRELARVIKPGGSLVMSVPNRWWVFETHGAELPLLPWNRVPFFSWLPKRIHDRYARARIYRRREITRKLERWGFTILRGTYITAPMDVVKWRPLQRALRKLIFSGDTTPVPFLSTAVLVVARRD